MDSHTSKDKADPTGQHAEDMVQADVENEIVPKENGALPEDSGEADEPQLFQSHFRNDSHPVHARYGVPFLLLCTLVLLINADIGSGVSAEFILTRRGSVVEEKELLVASIFSSVKELWDNGSYPLAILIVVTSILWPYLKIGLAFYAWFTPYQLPRKRERLVEIIDALGKWSFVDIVVLVEIMVAFRSEIALFGSVVTSDIVITAKWGFYGFVLATMMSLLSSHIILHYHRHVHYTKQAEISTRRGSEDSKDESPGTGKDQENACKTGLKGKGQLNNGFLYLAGLGVLFSIGFYLVGIFVDIYTVISSRGDIRIVNDYSIISVGTSIPDSQVEPDEIGIRFLQALWFLLCVVMPILCSCLFGALFLLPLKQAWIERFFFFGEITFAWSCAEVLLVSTIFAVLQMPTFGDGLIDADCNACFVVDTEILGTFAFLCTGSVLNVAVNIFLYRKAHALIYGIQQ